MRVLGKPFARVFMPDAFERVLRAVPAIFPIVVYRVGFSGAFLS